MAKLKDKLKEDAKYLQYRSIYKTVVGSLDTEKMIKEARLLHKSRKSRMLWEVRVSPQKLQDAILTDVSTRSRLVELRTLLMLQQELLATTISTCKKHVRTQYAEEVQSHGTTKDAQNLVVDRIFASGIETLSEIDGCVSVLDIYVKDIDAAGFALTNVTKTLVLFLDRKEPS